ncbi:MAG TPA: pyridoxal 5'-phosphate synthase glutaminase subunit PdxT [Ruminiclostridium sp.]|nr:pyridoxal 5'-phosphate synthase glutaminase subunit PdxT [Ruminiclostridium sp.]
MKTIGVLALQGSFLEHAQMLSKITNVRPALVKTLKELDSVDGLIIPGGESTTMGKLLKDFELFNPLKEKIESGLPVFGTCAGMILLAKRISGGEPYHLGVIDITVRRNAYGSQLDSFSKNIIIDEVSPKPIEAVFIRAPWIEKAGGGVKVLASLDNNIVAARQNNIVVTSFHPELTGDTSFHRYFADLI